eukprot:Pgem_evm1s556
MHAIPDSIIGAEILLDGNILGSVKELPPSTGVDPNDHWLRIMKATQVITVSYLGTLTLHNIELFTSEGFSINLQETGLTQVEQFPGVTGPIVTDLRAPIDATNANYFQLQQAQNNVPATWTLYYYGSLYVSTIKIKGNPGLAVDVNGLSFGKIRSSTLAVVDDILVSYCKEDVDHCTSYARACFDQTRSVVCEDCSERFALNKNTNECEKLDCGLPPNCVNASGCLNNVAVCTGCNENYYVDSNYCSECTSVGNCSQHAGICSKLDKTMECLDCNTGYQRVTATNQCVQCVNNTQFCETYNNECFHDTNDLECTSCPASHYLDNNKCRICSGLVQNCATHDASVCYNNSNVQLCTLCNTGFHFSDGECKECIKHSYCSESDSSMCNGNGNLFCLQCLDGDNYSLEDGKCNCSSSAFFNAKTGFCDSYAQSQHGSEDKDTTTIIIAAVVSVSVVLIAIIACVIFWFRRKKTKTLRDLMFKDDQSAHDFLQDADGKSVIELQTDQEYVDIQNVERTNTISSSSPHISSGNNNSVASSHSPQYRNVVPLDGEENKWQVLDQDFTSTPSPPTTETPFSDVNSKLNSDDHLSLNDYGQPSSYIFSNREEETDEGDYYDPNSFAFIF